MKDKKDKKVEKKDKYTLLDEVDKERKRDVDNLSFTLLVTVFLALFISLLIVLPNIYLKNEIYYKSRKISKLYNEYSILREENRVLKNRVEKMRFKNQVLDTIF